MRAANNFRIGRIAFFAVVLLTGRAFAQSDAPVHYYDAAIGKTGAALKSALQSIIKGQTVIPYTSSSTDTWDALSVLDQDPANSNNVVLIYSGLTVLKTDQNHGSGGAWDREHLWPQSFGIIALNGNSRARNDLFNLRPINPSVNSSRHDKYYDTSTPPIQTRPDAPGSSSDSNSWEPRDPDKGPIARALFYMAVRYDGSDADVPDLELSDSPDATQYRFGKLTTVLAWHRIFSVGTAERQRNTTIYLTYQHNRNPFVDHADYAEMVFNGVSPGQAWKDTNFTATELADPLVGGDSADPDGDGLSNLLEYAFSRDPWEAEPPPITMSLTSQSGNYSLLVSYSHNRNATDVALTYEATSDLQNWTTVSPQPVSTIVTSSETEQVTVRVPAPMSSYFVRMRATRTGP